MGFLSFLAIATLFFLNTLMLILIALLYHGLLLTTVSVAPVMCFLTQSMGYFQYLFYFRQGGQ